MARLTVVVSQAQGRNPEKRQLEEDIITELMMQRGLEVIVVPHFYDLEVSSTAILALRGLSSNAVILSWMFPRAAHWLLDRNDIRGKMGTVLLTLEDEPDEDEEAAAIEKEQRARVIDSRALPNRYLYHIDFRTSNKVADYLAEIRRIQSELSVSVVSLGPGKINGKINGSTPGKDSANRVNGSVNGVNGHSHVEPSLGLGGAVIGNKAEPPAGVSAEAMRRMAAPTNTTALGFSGVVEVPAEPAQAFTFDDLFNSNQTENVADQDADQVNVQRLTESAAKRRWYPVIDYSRCTNCMECIDFCLFGVYGVDTIDTILVEQPDNCRKGCPACSRVCPENAIIFPQHKTPAIAGSQDDVGGFKIDLSKLFGAPDENKTPEEVAARERDEQLMLTGRQPVGLSVGVKRKSRDLNAPKDQLDQLIDQLDSMDL